MVPEFEARRQIVEVGRRIWQRGYVAANDGNLSSRLDGTRLLVTPTGVSKGFLKPEDLIVVDLEGRVLSGGREPTSELAMHLLVYGTRSDVGGVVHAHPPKATGFAVAGAPLAQCVLPEVILSLGTVPLAAYATPSTTEVCRSIGEFLADYNAMLLHSHGALTLGSDIFEAYYRMETVEHFAEITLAAKALGGPSPLSQEEVRKLLNVREKLGIQGPPAQCVSCGACDSAGTGERTGSTPNAQAGAASASAPERPEGVDEDIVRAVLREVEKTLGAGRPRD